MPDGTRTHLAVTGVGLLLLNAWAWIFGAFFPTRNGTLGHDWAHKLPLLLDGTNWFLQNGWRSLPWFTPSFCGGIPLFPHPASFYVSLPQWLSFVMDPLRAAHYALLVLAAAALVATYRLLRRVYRLGEWASLLGAGVFLFNGFFFHRMLIGHLEFHGFMLAPLLALCLLGGDEGAPRWRRAGRVLVAAALCAYMFLSGATQLFFPLLLSLVALWLMALLAVPGQRASVFPMRLLAAGVLALALGASKLTGSVALLLQMPRDYYPLPGIDGLGNTAWWVLVALVRGGRAVDLDAIVSPEFETQAHELEYGVTPIPFLLLLAWGGFAARAGPPGRRRPTPARLVQAAALGLLLALPVILNVRSVGVHLEAAPVIGSLSSLLRWVSLTLLPLALASGLALERLPLARWRGAMAVGALGAVAAVNALSDRTYYHEQRYPPDAVVAASQRAHARGAPTPISGIEAAIVDGEIVLAANRNDVMVRGMSQLACYEPLFGFRLERFPRGDLRPGPALETRGGRLNLKNPACYLYPEENDCAPGDHFRVDQIDAARRFTHFQPFPWKRSRIQRVADAVSLAALLGCLAAALALAVAALRERLSRAGGPGRAGR